ncbi:MAG TPA: HIT family protein [Nitrososphaeraceae archaeon]|jgi:histidine triad (HIT) family protein|nr:HIT family protein [Nitrososphaeraceae archaeon]
MTRPCLFCSIIKYKMPAIIIYEDKDFVALMDKYPISPGHSLVIPRSHHESLLSMTPSEVGNLYSAVSTISRAVISAVNADGFSIGQNNGRVANQIIPHVHVHIIPRYEDDSREGRWPSRKIGNIEQLTSTAQKIKSVLHVYSDIGLSDT